MIGDQVKFLNIFILSQIIIPKLLYLFQTSLTIFYRILSI